MRSTSSLPFVFAKLALRALRAQRPGHQRLRRGDVDSPAARGVVGSAATGAAQRRGHVLHQGRGPRLTRSATGALCARIVPRLGLSPITWPARTAFQ